MAFLKNNALKLCALIACALLWPTPVQAAEGISFASPRQQATLMEVYVSQGCSSCPPAQNWVNQLIDSPRLWKDVVPVVFHVDYWDYLGWKDPFSSHDTTERQRAYKTQGRVGSVYTPGFVVNGKEWRGWFRGGSLPEENKSAGVLQARLESGQLSASYQTDTTKDLVLNVAVLGFGLKTDVTRGENRDRLLTEDFVVLSFESHPSNDGNWQFTFPPKIPKASKRAAVALWVSRKGDFTPLQATGGWLPQEAIDRSQDKTLASDELQFLDSPDDPLSAPPTRLCIVRPFPSSPYHASTQDSAASVIPSSVSQRSPPVSS